MKNRKFFVVSIVPALLFATSISFAGNSGVGTSPGSQDGKCPMMKMMNTKEMKCKENMEKKTERKDMHSMMEKCTMMKSQGATSPVQSNYAEKTGKTRQQVLQELSEHQERMRSDRAYAQEWRSMYETN